ncbi:MAG: PKD domain-containing protein [Planctomycetota bacterium]|nr:PKD domain-containing protein [Planctomycetota bacterium]
MSGSRCTVWEFRAARWFMGLLLATVFSAHAAAPVAAISASPGTGSAPLGVLFDASASSADVQSYLWEFGDGSASTAKTVTHIYITAGTYTTTLTVTNAEGLSASSQITITVTGNAEGPVTQDMSFRWVTTSSAFTLKHGQTNKDKFALNATFNAVDLPLRLDGLAASFSINGRFTISGVLGQAGAFENPQHNAKPTYFVLLNPVDQLLTISISKASLGDALALSGAGDANVASPGAQVPVTCSLTIGAQTYTLTENYTYVSAAGGSARGEFNLKMARGSVADGFLVVSRASALESLEGTAHYFEFDGYLSRPAAQALQVPGTGTYRFKFNDADPVILLFDRIRRTGSKVVYSQPDRELGGIRELSFDVVTRRMIVKTTPHQGRRRLADRAPRQEISSPSGRRFTGSQAVRQTDPPRAAWRPQPAAPPARPAAPGREQVPTFPRAAANPACRAHRRSAARACGGGRRR